MSGVESERFWDEKARENAWYYVDNEIGYQDPDTEAFWRRGEEVVEQMLGTVGLEIGPGETVVDIGCGMGRLTRALAARAQHVYGLDVSQEMLRLAREHNPELANVDWLHGDGLGLGVLADGSADGCFSHVVFQHIPDAAITLDYVRDMGRVLRPSGWALFQVSSNPEIHRRPVSGLRGRVKAVLGRDDDERAWWGSHVEIDALRQAAADGGLTVERVLDEGSQFTTVYLRKPA